MPTGRVRVYAGIVVAVVTAAAIGASPVAASRTSRMTDAPARISATSEAPVPCPQVLGESAINTGMAGTGWTVTSGDAPRAFRVRVLGTLQDGIAPGRDLVIIKVSDLPGKHVISQGNGIWAGMSGSPVYLGGKLAGAISYGFSEGPSRIGGMTPAAQMQRIASSVASRSRASSSERTTVRLSSSLRGVVARDAGIMADDVPTLRRLAVPMIVSSPRGALGRRLTAALRREFGTIRVMAGASARASAAAPLAGAPVPGGNIAAVISSGDVTVAAVGTTTSVCGADVLAFGHPMTGNGKVAFGAARASAITIVDDPGGTPFKMANIGGMFGLVDQDRQSGIHGIIGRRPRGIPVVARVRSTESGHIRTGRTSVTTSSWVPIVAANHLLSDILATADREGPGTAIMTWTIRGTRPSGAHWSLVRSDRVTTTESLALDAGQTLLDLLTAIDQTPAEKVRFDGVTMNVTVSPQVKSYIIRSVQVSRNGGSFRDRTSIAAHPGDRLRFKVRLKIYKGGFATAIIGLTVPATATGSGFVTIGADSLAADCSFDTTQCPTSFNGLLGALRDAPGNDDLEASLDLSGFEEGGTKVTATKRLDKVVEGSIELPIDVQ